MSEQQFDAAMDLMLRLPPTSAEENLGNIIDLVPDLMDDLLRAVDQPLKVATDKETQKPYLLCDFNRDGDSYRSPWSNKYDPPLDDGAAPSEKLRKLEVQANEAFDTYRELYFDGGVSSVYVWDVEGGSGFACAVLIKKVVGDSSGDAIKGCWDAIHVFEVTEKPRVAAYALTSTVMLWMQTNKSQTGSMRLGGYMQRRAEAEKPVSDARPHVANIGEMVEEMEGKMRSTLNDIYFGKTKDTVNEMRSLGKMSDRDAQMRLQADIAKKLGQRQ
eukprot:comp11426_c0_seq1/m.5832 comp11426_c0_seq1/g.5832  ORF comp11426_c0_seq1/g.5832 comp11426_c0_seq1/m.5832 type:complete len:273 (-) comp11426_c0_seq1:285-1103(-)